MEMWGTVKTRIKELTGMFISFVLMPFLHIGYLMKNQPEAVLNMYLNSV